jgi:hypothetical protein
MPLPARRRRAQRPCVARPLAYAALFLFPSLRRRILFTLCVHRTACRKATDQPRREAGGGRRPVLVYELADRLDICTSCARPASVPSNQELVCDRGPLLAEVVLAWPETRPEACTEDEGFIPNAFHVPARRASTSAPLRDSCATKTLGVIRDTRSAAQPDRCIKPSVGSRRETAVSTDVLAPARTADSRNPGGHSNDPAQLARDRHFDAHIRVQCVRWYITYKLSFRDLQEMMAERGVTQAHTATRRSGASASRPPRSRSTAQRPP